MIDFSPNIIIYDIQKGLIERIMLLLWKKNQSIDIWEISNFNEIALKIAHSSLIKKSCWEKTLIPIPNKFSQSALLIL